MSTRVSAVLLRFLAFFLFVSLAPMVLHGQDSNPDSPSSGQDRTTARAQTSHTPEEIKGFNEYEVFQGVVDSARSILKLDSTLGYDFNNHVGVFVGVPLYFVRDSGTSTTTNLNTEGAGDVYFGAELYAPSRYVNYATSLTVSAPTGNVSKGFSTGHRTVDWSNRLRHRFGRLAPFVVAGVSNTVPDSDLVTRTFTSLGNVVHLEEGADFDLTRRIYVGASAYHIFPFGNQQVFNRADDNTNRGPGSAGQNQKNQPSVTGSSVTRENGFDTWLGFEPTRVLRMEAGYSRSATFALNRFSFNVGLNVGRMIRAAAHHNQ